MTEDERHLVTIGNEFAAIIENMKITLQKVADYLEAKPDMTQAEWELYNEVNRSLLSQTPHTPDSERKE